jgi:hypothetical protein
VAVTLFLFQAIHLKWGEWWRSWFNHCIARREVAGSISGQILGNFQVTYFFLSALISPVGAVRPARRAENSVVLVVLNVRVRLEVQHSIPHLSFHNLLMGKHYLSLN